MESRDFAAEQDLMLTLYRVPACPRARVERVPRLVLAFTAVLVD